MTVLMPSTSDPASNEVTFDVYLASALRVLASVEFSGLLSEDGPTRELLLVFAGEMERYARDLAELVGECMGVEEAGRAWFEASLDGRDDVVQAGYHSLHVAAYLGLSGGMNTVWALSAVGSALRVLAEREGRLTN